MSQLSATALSTCVRDVIDFVGAAGWDQPPQLFALVPTAELLAAHPELAGGLSAGPELTPVAQEALPSDAAGRPLPLDEALATIHWPDAVAGCALVQEIVILPPGADAELGAGDEHALRHAAEHPARREARLVAGVLRDGASLSLMQLRGDTELLEHPDLAPHLTGALLTTFV